MPVPLSDHCQQVAIVEVLGGLHSDVGRLAERAHPAVQPALLVRVAHLGDVLLGLGVVSGSQALLDEGLEADQGLLVLRKPKP